VTRYNTYEKECLAIVFGCAKVRSYLEHKRFESHCDNLALCWVFHNVKDIGMLGRWILRLVPFKFRVHHAKGTDYMVADSFLAKVGGLPLVYTTLEEQQNEDPLGKDLL